MKAYVLPVEKACNAHCKFCITNFRKMNSKHLLNPAALEKILKRIKPERIEITGGGEPTLHPVIGDIIALCAKTAPSQLYTHGYFKFFSEINRLSCLCISRHHYNDGINKELMGVSSNMVKLRRQVNVPIKLSLLLLKSGINSLAELKNYLNWAADVGADKVVARQLFDPGQNRGYLRIYENEFVSTRELAKKIDKDFSFSLKKISEDNLFYGFKGLDVELELRSCACKEKNSVIHAEGAISGWDDLK